MYKHSEKIDEILDIEKIITLLRKEFEAKEVLMIAMKIMKSLISPFRPYFLLKTKILVNVDVYFATKMTTLPIIN